MPGETYETLKSKATQQAKQSGMSQNAAENYGSAMATQAVVQGDVSIHSDFMGANEEQKNKTIDEIMSNVGTESIPPSFTDFSETATQNVQDFAEARKKSAQEMKDKGGVFNPQTGMVEYPQQTNIFGGLGSLSLENIPSLTLQAGIGGAKALQALLDKVFKPQVSDFSNPNFLAVLDAAFKSGKLNEESWKETYGELLDDVYGGQGIGSLDQATGDTSLDSEGLFNLAMEEATANVEPGSGTQRITDPKGFYLDDGQGILPQTSGGLTDLAGLDVNQFTSGPGYNKDMVDMIFAARAELDRMGKNPMTGESQNQPIGFSSPEMITGKPMDMKKPIPPTSPPVPITGGTTPFDLAQFYANLPSYSYGQQGVMSPSINPNLASYYDNLRRYYG